MTLDKRGEFLQRIHALKTQAELEALSLVIKGAYDTKSPERAELLSWLNSQRRWVDNGNPKCKHLKTRWGKTYEDHEADRYMGGLNESEICRKCGCVVNTAREVFAGSE